MSLFVILISGLALRHYMAKHYVPMLDKEAPGAKKFFEAHHYSFSSMLSDLIHSAGV